MDKCEWCKKEDNRHGIIMLELEKGKSSKPICMDCFNNLMADKLEVDDFKSFDKTVNFMDCEGINHIFEIDKRILPMGIRWEANEYVNDHDIGYSFSITQELDGRSSEAISRLYRKIKNGISQKFITIEEHGGHEIVLIKESKVEGRIEWDDEYDGRIPRLIIDGKSYDFLEFGQMLMAYEGWNFNFEIHDVTE